MHTSVFGDRVVVQSGELITGMLHRTNRRIPLMRRNKAETPDPLVLGTDLNEKTQPIVTYIRLERTQSAV